MRLGYSTNSVGDVDPLDAIPVLRDLGYRSLAITLDHHTIDPFADDRPTRGGEEIDDPFNIERPRRGDGDRPPRPYVPVGDPL